MNHKIKKYTQLLISLPCLISCSVPTETTRQTPMMGWSSWNSYRVNISDEIIRAAADSLITKGLADLGYRHVNIDDGWFGGVNGDGRNADRTVRVNRERFPNGMRAVADYIHSRGLKAGLYSDAGSNTCGSIYDNDMAGVGVGMWQHDDVDAKTFFVDWNFDHIKIDFCGGGETGKSDYERYTSIRGAIDGTGRKDVTMNICRWEFPGTWAMHTGNSWRVATDIYPNWKDVVKQFQRNLYLSAYAGPGHFNDMDMLEIGNPESQLSRQQEYSHFALWCFMKSPLMIGGKLTTLNAEQLAIYSNKALIEINQDQLGEQPHVIWRTENQYILVADLQQSGGLKRTVCFFNDSDEPYDFTLNLNTVCLGGEVIVHNACSNKEEGVFNGIFGASLAPYEAVVYTLEGERRLQQIRYEAENGFLNNYKPDQSPDRAVAMYASAADVSAKGHVVQLGGSPDNWLQFNDVRVDESGDYTLKVAYKSPEKRNMNIVVNEEQYACTDLITPTHEGKILTLNVSLQKGSNTIRISNSEQFAPDIDYIEII